MLTFRYHVHVALGDSGSKRAPQMTSLPTMVPSTFLRIQAEYSLARCIQDAFRFIKFISKPRYLAAHLYPLTAVNIVLGRNDAHLCLL